MEIEKHNYIVHVGKSGGSTISVALRKSGYIKDYKMIHIRKANFFPNASYVIVARDPISRMVSAFNWRYKIVVDDKKQTNRFPSEKDILIKYGSIERLASSLYDQDGHENSEATADAMMIHHIKENISFHIGGILNKCRPEQIKGVVMQETLAEDAQRIFGITVSGRLKANPVNTPLSEAARRNLKKFLLNDYLCLTKLHCWGKIASCNWC